MHVQGTLYIPSTAQPLRLSQYILIQTRFVSGTHHSLAAWGKADLKLAQGFFDTTGITGIEPQTPDLRSHNQE